MALNGWMVARSGCARTLGCAALLLAACGDEHATSTADDEVAASVCIFEFDADALEGSPSGGLELHGKLELFVLDDGTSAGRLRTEQGQTLEVHTTLTEDRIALTGILPDGKLFMGTGPLSAPIEQCQEGSRIEGLGLGPVVGDDFEGSDRLHWLGVSLLSAQIRYQVVRGSLLPADGATSELHYKCENNCKPDDFAARCTSSGGGVTDGGLRCDCSGSSTCDKVLAAYGYPSVE